MLLVDQKPTNTDNLEAGRDGKLCFKEWLAKNNPTKLKKERDFNIRVMRYVNAILMVYLLLTPMIPILPTISHRAWIIGLLMIPIGLIIVCYFEYWFRTEVWHILACRGILLQFHKQRWLVKAPMLLVYFFILTVAVLVAIGSDGQDTWKRIVLAVGMILALSFAITLVKGAIELEAANRIYTVNSFMDQLDNMQLLEPLGWKVIDQSQLINWVDDYYASNEAKAHADGEWTWDALYGLGHERVPLKNPHNPLKRWAWGARVRRVLGPHMNTDQ